MTETEIKKLLLTGECVTLECKRAKSEVPKSLMKYSRNSRYMLLKNQFRGIYV